MQIIVYDNCHNFLLLP